MPSVITANRLQDGLVVYLAENGSWERSLSAARVADSKDGISALETLAAQAAKEQIIVGAYPMDVDLTAGGPTPKSVRERIRAAHRPTIRSVSEER